MLERLLTWSAKVFRHPIPVVIVFVIIALISAAGFSRIKLDNSIRSMIPQDDPALLTNDYYEDESRFGASAMVIVGVQAPDVLQQDVLQYVRDLEKRLSTLSSEVPARLAASLFGLDTQDSKKVVQDIRTLGITADNYQQTLIPVITDPVQLKSKLGWDDALSAKVAAVAQKTAPKTLFRTLHSLVKEVKSILSSDYIANEDDTLVVQKMVEDDPITQASIDRLKNRLAAWNVYEGLMISRDHTMTTVLVKPNEEDITVQGVLLQAVREMIGSGGQPAGVKIIIDGQPVIENSIGAFMSGDMSILMPLVSVVVLLILYLCFRKIQGVLYPLALMAIAVVTSVGIMSWFNTPITIVSSVMPVLLVAIASAYGIHMMNHYFLDPAHDKVEIFTRHMGTVGLAIALSGVTVMVGFGALVSTSFVPIKNFGLYTAVGDLFALGAALWLLPSLVVLSKKPKTFVATEKETGFFSNILHLFVRWNQRYSKEIVIGTAVVVAVFFAGSFLVKSDMNLIAFFKNDSEIHQADDFMNDKLAGTQSLNFVFDSDLSSILQRKPGDRAEVVDLAIQPELLKRIDAYSADVQKEFPYVGKVLSFNDMLKKMNREMNDGTARFSVIPDDPNLISQYLLMISQDSLKDVLSSNHDNLRVSLQMKQVSSADVEKVRQYTLRYFEPDFLKAHHVQLQTTGHAYLGFVANGLLVEGNLESIVLCVVIVFILLLVVLRSFWMSLIALIPIFGTLAINFGVLGLSGITLNIGTTMVSSIAIGIGVDYSIHFITWYRSEIRKWGQVPKALEESILHKGRAILYNMIVIVGGFIVLVFSRFVPLIEFGALVSLCMVTTALGALVIVPAVLRQLTKANPKFLYLK